MNRLLVLGVIVFGEDGDPVLEDQQATEPIVYSDGTVEVSGDTGDGERAYFRFSLAELVRIALASAKKEAE